MKNIIIADDMTGANVSNSLLAKDGFTVGTISSMKNLNTYENYDTLGVHTDSRGVSSKEAYNIVEKKMEKLKHLEVSFFTKRIDSTLRGNNGAELNAMIDVLNNDELAIVVPAFPDSGKIVIGNYMLVNGVPLERTDVKNDPTSPVKTSRIINIFKEQTNKEVAVISMETVLEGIEAIKDTIYMVKENGAKIVLIDACTNEDIDNISKATLESKLNFIAVDPGPFTYYLAKNSKDSQKYKTQRKILFVIGSVSSITISQIARLRTEHNPYVVQIDARKLLDNNKREAEKKRIEKLVLKHFDNNEMFLLTTMAKEEDKLDLNIECKKYDLTMQQASEIISRNTADIGNRVAIILGDTLGGVYTSGGDITKAFLELTNAVGIKIKNEIIPLAVYGTIIGGELHDKSIVTKGGLIGDQYTLTQCTEYLQTKISDRVYKESELQE